MFAILFDCFSLQNYSNEVNHLVALHELYKYINKYYDQVQKLNVICFILYFIVDIRRTLTFTKCTLYQPLLDHLCSRGGLYCPEDAVGLQASADSSSCGE